MRVWPPSSGRHALRIGALWLVLTVLVEAFMGMVLMHRSFSQVLIDYDVMAGRVWVFFFLWLTLAPWLYFHMRRAG